MLPCAVVMSACVNGGEPARSGAGLVDFATLFPAERRVLLQDDAEPLGKVEDLALWGGRLLVVDGMEATLRVFDESGNLIRRIGRTGDGPGEFREPIAAVALQDGRLAVLDRGRMFVSFFDSAGVFTGGWQVPGISPGGLEVLPDGGLLIAAQITSDRRVVSRFALHVFDLRGEIVASFRETPEPEHPSEGSFNRVVAGLVGRIAVSGHLSSNQVHHRDLRSGREWSFPVGLSVYRAPDWPRRPWKAVPDVLAWANRQMWLKNIIAVDTSTYLATFTTYSEKTRSARYMYSVMSLDGTELAATAPTEWRVDLVADGKVYATRTDERGRTEVHVGFFKPEPSSVAPPVRR